MFNNNGGTKIKKIFFAIICMLCLINGYSSDSEYSQFLPDMGDPDRASLSPTDANFLGNQVIQQLMSKGEMVKDYDTDAYLNNIGNNLVSYSPLAGQRFHFYVIKDKEINAFALPGGYICVYNGLIYYANTEAELVSVLSHEIGHVVQHHVFRDIGVYNRNQGLAIAGAIAGGLLAILNPGLGILAASGSQGLAIQNMLSFSREFEREADRVGQKIMYAAGYDLHAMPEFFSRMQDLEKFNNNQAIAFLQTHPVTSERLSEAEERANQYSTKMRADSLSFSLIREKAIVRQLGANEAIIFYKDALKKKRYAILGVVYYGLADAEYTNADYKLAEATLRKIKDSEITTHPAYYSLLAQTLLAEKNYSGANKVFNQGLSRYPDYKGLWIGQVGLYLKAKEFKQAASRLYDLSQSYPLDEDIWEQEAIIYSDAHLNNPQKYHYALGNLLYVETNYLAALQQYQLALKMHGKVTDNDLSDIISSKIFETQNALRYKSQFAS